MARRNGSAFDEVREPDEDAVARRLRELGIPLATTTHAIRVGFTKGDFVSVAHPRTYQGMVVWGELTGELRGGLLALGTGWDLDDTDNIARAVNGSVIVVAVRGNEYTGLRSKYEQLNTYRPRGNAGVRIVRTNGQFELALQDGASVPNPDLIGGLGGTWFLLYNRVGDVVRRELSFARGVDEDGKLLEWSERLILPDIDLLQPSPPDEDDDVGPTIVVPVTRRVS